MSGSFGVGVARRLEKNLTATFGIERLAFSEYVRTPTDGATRLARARIQGTDG